MATLNAKDFLRTLVFGHFTHPNYQQIKFTFDNGVLGFEMKDTKSGNEFKVLVMYRTAKTLISLCVK